MGLLTCAFPMEVIFFPKSENSFWEWGGGKIFFLMQAQRYGVFVVLKFHGWEIRGKNV